MVGGTTVANGLSITRLISEVLLDNPGQVRPLADHRHLFRPSYGYFTEAEEIIKFKLVSMKPLYSQNYLLNIIY